MVKYELIENKKDLQRVAALFEKEKTIAVDLEADSMFHFKEKVCLIQMASKNLTVVIDPLKIGDLSSLKTAFVNPSIRKIFHGCDYDVRSLHRDHDIEINNLFDTELASRFLGVPETGLSAVLGKRFGVKLDKSYQKKDWSMRPLPPEMIAYGASDVAYLLPLAEMLDSELKEKNRVEWVKEECEALSRVRAPEPNGDPLFLRIKGAGRLDRRSLGTLELLLEMRRDIAEKKDKPLFKIFSNSSLLTLSKARPGNLDALKDCRVFSLKQSKIFGKEILEALENASALPDKALPVYPRKKKIIVKPGVANVTQKIKDWRDRVACELELEPPILFNKAMLTAIAVKKPDTIEAFKAVGGIKNWQVNEFGHQIIDVLKDI